MPAESYRSTLTDVALPDWLADAIVAMYSPIRASHGAAATDGVHRLTGRPARSYCDVAEAHRSDCADA